MFQGGDVPRVLVDDLFQGKPGIQLKALGEIPHAQVWVAADTPVARRLEPRQDTHQGGLSTAVGTHETGSLPWIQAE
jgi:hypothetical protein